MNNFICHSGGAPGADTIFETCCEEFGIKVIAYSFKNHDTKSKNGLELSIKELNEGFEHVMIAERTLNRRLDKLPVYVKNLLARNWYQVKNSDAVFAVSTFQNNIVSGGTGWACQMAIDNKKPIYLFDQSKNGWFKFDYDELVFMFIDYIPTLTKNFAGIGTREINEHGIDAILQLIKENVER